METSDLLALLDLVVKVALGVIGLFGLHTYQQHRRLRLAQDRLKPYAALWAATGLMRSGVTMTPALARELDANLREWYYGEHGGALVLPIPTLKMLMLLLADLRDLGKSDQPAPTVDKADSTVHEARSTVDPKRVEVAVSLLRTQLKLDLDVYDVDERRQLGHAGKNGDDAVPARRRDVLAAACVNPEHWGRAPRPGRPKAFHWEHYSGTGIDGRVVALTEPCPDSQAGARQGQSSPAAS